MRLFIGIILLFNLLFGEDFISKFEYGQMLYENPRGVSCKKCHGKVGEGAFIASFIDAKGKKHEFYGPDIRGLDFKSFKKHIESGGRIMPRFFLTNKELEALYEFIRIVNMPPKEKEEALLKQNEVDFAPKEEIQKVVEANIKKEQNRTKEPNETKQTDDPIEVNDIFEDNDDIANVQEIDNNAIFEDDEEAQISDNNKSSIISNIFNNLSNESDEIIDEPINNEAVNIDEESY